MGSGCVWLRPILGELARPSISSILAGHLEIGCSVNASTRARYLMLLEMLELPFLVMCRFADVT